VVLVAVCLPTGTRARSDVAPSAARVGPSPSSELISPGASGTPSHVRTAGRPAVTGAGDWPMYMGSPEHTADNVAERTIGPVNVSRLVEAWNVSTNGSAMSAPIVVEGTVYWGEWNGYEYAANATDGRVLWSTYLGDDPNCYAHGITSSPAFSNGTLYLGAPNGSWDALNASTGDVVWTSPVGGPTSAGYYDWASALLFDRSLYVGQASCDDDPLVRGAVLEVNLTGNHTANHTWTATSPGDLGSTVWTTPTADPSANTLWVTTGNDNGTPQPYAQSVVALNATTLAVRGSWQVPDVIGTDSDFGSTATLVSPANGTPLVVTTNKNGVLYALDRSNVSASGWGPVWSRSTGGGWSGAAFNGTTLFVAGGSSVNGTGVVYALGPETGAVEWQTALPSGFPIASLTYADGLVFVDAGDMAYALGSSNGTVLWALYVPGTEQLLGEPVVVDGELFVPAGTYAGGQGQLFAFRLSFRASAGVLAPNGSAPWTATFEANATGSDGPYEFDWTFDDGGVASGSVVAHEFAHAGSHWGGVVVEDSAGPIAAFHLAVNTDVAGPPLGAGIAASTVRGEVPFAVNFQAMVTNGSGPPYGAAWAFGDGSTGSGSSVTHTFDAAGTFTVRLQESAPGDQIANASLAILALPPLTGTLRGTEPRGSVPLRETFVLTIQGGSSPYSIAWSFGDGRTATGGTDQTHTYPDPGSFEPEGDVTDGLSGHLALTAHVTTSVPPFNVSANWTNLATTCDPFTNVDEFTAEDSNGGAPFTNTWTFGDGSSGATGDVVRHTYFLGGPFHVTVASTDAAGARASANLTVYELHTTCPTRSVVGGPAVNGIVLVGIAVFVVIAVGVDLARRRGPGRRGGGPDGASTRPGP
jgi:outer membrane protein assembly factor BamB